MTDQGKEPADLYAGCHPGEDRGEYIRDDGPPRVWDGEKWLTPRAALEAGVVDKWEVLEELTEDELGNQTSHALSSCLFKIPGYFVLDLGDSDFGQNRKGLEFFEDLEKAKAEYWTAIREAVADGEVEPSDIGRKVHYRSVYSEDGGGGFWETAEVYDCDGFAVIDYGSFPQTCNVPRFEIHDTVDEAKGELESFVDGLESDAQGNIDYEWRATVWNEGEEEEEYGASWQEEEEEEQDEDEDDDDEEEDEGEEDGDEEKEGKAAP